MSLAQAQSTFINASKFAVIGRVLTDRQRWDNKVLRWYVPPDPAHPPLLVFASKQVKELRNRYIDHNLPVTPILPPEAKSAVGEVEGLAVISDPTELPDLSETSISIIINPTIGLQILKSFYPPISTSSGTRITRSNSSIGKGPKGVWFQPGAESPDIRAYVKEMGLNDRVICSGNGECILEDGEEVLKMRKKGSEGSRL